jgi:hypothetical protein
MNRTAHCVTIALQKLIIHIIHREPELICITIILLFVLMLVSYLFMYNPLLLLDWKNETRLNDAGIASTSELLTSTILKWLKLWY